MKCLVPDHIIIITYINAYKWIKTTPDVRKVSGSISFILIFLGKSPRDLLDQRIPTWSPPWNPWYTMVTPWMARNSWCLHLLNFASALQGGLGLGSEKCWFHGAIWHHAMIVMDFGSFFRGFVGTFWFWTGVWFVFDGFLSCFFWDGFT